MPSPAGPSPCQALSGSGPAEPLDIASVRNIQVGEFPRFSRQSCTEVGITERDEVENFAGFFPDSSDVDKRFEFLIRLVGAARERFAEAGEFLMLQTRPTVIAYVDETTSMDDFWGDEGPATDEAFCKIEHLRRQLAPLGIQTLKPGRFLDERWGGMLGKPVPFNLPGNDASTSKWWAGAIFFIVWSDEAVDFADVPGLSYHETLYKEGGSGDRPRQFKHRTTSAIWQSEEDDFLTGTNIPTGPKLDGNGDPIPNSAVFDPGRPKYELVGGLVLAVAIYEQFLEHRTNPVFVPVNELVTFHERDLRFKPFQPIFGQFLRKALKRLDQYAGLPPVAEYVPTMDLHEDGFDWPLGADASVDDEDGAIEESFGADTATTNKASVAPLADLGFHVLLGYERYDLTIQESGQPYHVDQDVRLDTFGVKVEHLLFRATSFFHLVYPDVPVSGAVAPIV